MKRDGFSLIQLLTAVAILGIVAAVGTVNYRGWVSKHDLEGQIRQMQADFMNARMMAMTKKASHFVTVAASQVKIYEDTNNNGTLETGTDTALCLWSRAFGQAADPVCSSAGVSLRTLKYPMTWNGTTPLQFNQRGLSNTPCAICVDYVANSSVPTSAAYDCVVISNTRIAAGKLTGVCNAANCQIQK